MITTRGASPHTLVLSTLCARCPMGTTGCCATPPALEWSDLGRIVSLGGASFLLDRIADGSLRTGPRGLFITRVSPREGEGARCVFHGPSGCTIEPDRRSATCNYYVCEDAIAHAGEGQGDRVAARARRSRDALTDRFGAWDRALADRVHARWPDGPPWDEGFLAWLADEAVTVSRGAIGRSAEDQGGAGRTEPTGGGALVLASPA